MKIILLTVTALLILGAYMISISETDAPELQKADRVISDNSVTKATDQNTPTTTKNTSAASLNDLINQSFPASDPGWAWDKVDMTALEEKYPDNLYWEMAVPTSDELILEQRKETREHWEKEYGKVLSGTASPLEVNAYYNYQHKLMTDYLTITQELLSNYSDTLPEQDLRLLNLAKNMQQSKLNDLPGHRKNSLAKSERQAEERQKWLADKEGYEKKMREQAQEASATYTKKSYN